MKKTEIILAIISAITILLMALWMPVSPFFILSMCGLTVMYQYFSFALLNDIRLRNAFKKQSYAAVSRGRIVGAVGAGLALSMATIGLLFGFMRWPGSASMLLPAALPLAIIAVISIIKMGAATDGFYKKMLVRVGVLGALTALFLTMPYFWFDLKYRDFPEYRAAVKAADAHPEDKALQQKEQEEYDKIFSVEG